MWATVGRRTFLVGTSAALLLRAGLAETGDSSSPVSSLADPYGFGLFAAERWPAMRLARPHPDYGIDYTALLPVARAVEGATVNVQLQEGQQTDDRVVAAVEDLLRWEEFAGTNARGLLIASSLLADRRRFFAIDSREARRRAVRRCCVRVRGPGGMTVRKRP